MNIRFSLFAMMVIAMSFLTLNACTPESSGSAGAGMAADASAADANVTDQFRGLGQECGLDEPCAKGLECRQETSVSTSVMCLPQEEEVDAGKAKPDLLLSNPCDEIPLVKKMAGKWVDAGIQSKAKIWYKPVKGKCEVFFSGADVVLGSTKNPFAKLVNPSSNFCKIKVVISTRACLYLESGKLIQRVYDTETGETLGINSYNRPKN